jgi:hypothetical protein
MIATLLTLAVTLAIIEKSIPQGRKAAAWLVQAAAIAAVTAATGGETATIVVATCFMVVEGGYLVCKYAD